VSTFITDHSDVDGLNDSEEINLGSDGFATDPWKTDTDGDGTETVHRHTPGSTSCPNPFYSSSYHVRSFLDSK